MSIRRHGRTEGLARQATLIAVAVLVSVPLSSCTVNASQDHVAVAGGAGVDAESDALWEHRTPFVGDNSKVIALIPEANFGPAGSYTIKLQTEKAPYGLSVAFPAADVSGQPLAAVNFTPAATKMLGTVGNREWVNVTGQGEPFSASPPSRPARRSGSTSKSSGETSAS